MRRYWLASYPKSGNTWVRLLIANIGRAEPASINAFGGRRSGIASAREWFEHALHLPSGLFTHDECDRLRPLVYAAGSDNEAGHEAAASPLTDLQFCKVHDSYSVLGDGNPLLAGAAGAQGAIVVVRDPRDIASSLANHLGSDLDHAIRFMADRNAGLCDTVRAQRNQMRQRLHGWSDHVGSWLDQTDLPIFVVRYERLLAEPTSALSDALEFCHSPVPGDLIERAVEFASFDRLREQEEREGFREAPAAGATSRFFRRGEAGGWREDLSENQIRAIESAHGAMMQRLGYPLEYGEKS